MTITFTDVSASYDKKAGAKNVLSGLHLTVSPGMRIALLGENGSGKTSLLKVLTGILPYEGSIRIDDQELRTLNRRDIGLRIAHLSQISGAYFSYTVTETVSHGRYLRQKGRALLDDSKEDYAAVAAVLEKTGLADIKDRPIDTLSGGQLQRVFLARAFAQETPVLLLDEPTSHLDLKYQAELADYLLNWSTQQTHLPGGTAHDNTLIGVFHDLALAKKIATDVLLLKDGRMLAYGDADSIFSDRDLLTEAFDFDVLTYLRTLSL